MSQPIKAPPRLPAAPANFESIETPGPIVKQLEGKSLAELSTIFRRAEVATARGWLLMACVVGVALEKAQHGDRAAGKLAAEFKCSERTIHRLAELFASLIRPRLTYEGNRARFPLEQQRFYTLAIEGADVTEKQPIELLEEAEREREKNPKFTAAAFKKRIFGGETEGAGREPKVLTLVRKLANAKVDVDTLASAANPAEVEALLDAATAKLTDARRSLRRPQAA